MIPQVIQKFRSQPHVSSVNLTQQWDTQHDSPNQSTFCDIPYTQLTRRAYATTPQAVAEGFIPAWRCLLVCLRKSNALSEGADVHALGDAIAAMHDYFRSHDWDITWCDLQVCKPVALLGCAAVL